MKARPRNASPVGTGYSRHPPRLLPFSPEPAPTFPSAKERQQMWMKRELELQWQRSFPAFGRVVIECVYLRGVVEIGEDALALLRRRHEEPTFA